MHILLSSERIQELHRLLVDTILGKVKEQVFKLQVELVEAFRVGCEHIFHWNVLHGGKMCLQGFPGGRGIESSRHGGCSVAVCFVVGSLV